MSELSLKSTSLEALYPVSMQKVEHKVEEAIELLKPMAGTLSKFGRSHTDAQWNTFVVGSEYGLSRQFSQVCAELKAKRDALVATIFGYKKNMLEAKIKEEQSAADGLLLSERELLLLEATEMRANANKTNDAIIGATKDVSQLENTYRLLEAKVKEKYGEFSEAALEKEERRYWVVRGFSQSMRDVRQSGTISKGEQKLLDDIGIDVSEAMAQIKGFLDFCKKQIDNSMSVPPSVRREFMEKMADTYESRVDQSIAEFGTTDRHLED